MTTLPSDLEILRQPGYLYWNPTDLSDEGTWGDILGFTEQGVTLLNLYNKEILTGEEGYPVDVLFLKQPPKLITDIKNWNQTSLQCAFPGLRSGSHVQSPNQLYSGTSLLTYAKPLLFMPLEDCNKVFLAQLAVGSFVNEYRLSASEDSILHLEFFLFRKTGTENYREFYIGSKENAVLL